MIGSSLIKNLVNNLFLDLTDKTGKFIAEKRFPLLKSGNTMSISLNSLMFNWVHS